MVLSKGCIYAIQAAIYIASADSAAGVVPAADGSNPGSGHASTHATAGELATELAWKRHRPSVSVGEISTALNISFHFLTKILQQLTSANLTHSHRGPNGGIALARPADEISLYDIIVAVDGPGLFLDCLLRPGYCGERIGNDSGTCAAHVVWEPIRKRFVESTKRTTVAALAEATLFSKDASALNYASADERATAAALRASINRGDVSLGHFVSPGHEGSAPVPTVEEQVVQ
jgi:Rrf2 family protein